MPIKLENVGIAVRDLEATISFFTDLGLTVVGRDTVSGEWTDTAVGLDGKGSPVTTSTTACAKRCGDSARRTRVAGWCEPAPRGAMPAASA